jgi:hypothetical protein
MTTDAEYEKQRLEILEDFWDDMNSRFGLQEPVKRSMDETRVKLGDLALRMYPWEGAKVGEEQGP